MIKILPENLINQIAAGEVVERPASCVKELIENSIDAKATRIVIEINKGGKNLIKITDNGIGMDREDAKLAFARHATSKISSQNDLFNIQTMGFRGEALPSIASVSQITIQTKKKDSLHGTLVQIEGGKFIKIEDIGCNQGTRIEVKNLFFNTPARKKYLKSEATEYGHILKIVTGIAAGYPEIAFKLICNGRFVFDLPETSDWHSRIYLLLGKDFANGLLPVFYGGSDLKIDGFVGLPDQARNNRNSQYLFINKREIKSPFISHAASEAYHLLLPNGKYPIFVMNLKIKPDLIDVNVHPRKLEVRFLNQQDVYSKVKMAVKASLEKNVLAPKVRFGDQRRDLISRTAAKTSFQHMDSRSAAPTKPLGNIKEALNFTRELSKTVKEFNFDRIREERLKTKPLAQIADSYIIAEEEDGITIIDQHAAHERIMYMKLKSNLEKQQPVSQVLLLPFNIELSYHEVKVLEENKSLLENLGFEIESFGGNTFTINSIPACMNQEDIVAVLKGVIDDLIDEQKIKEIEKRQEKIIHYLACRSAVKFGKSLSYEEQIGLLKELEELSQKYTCPHGRPTMIKLTFEELEKKFGRR